MNQLISSKTIALTFGILVICFLAAFYVIAWQEPTEAPPEGNVATPLNTSNVGQSKEGGLLLHSSSEFSNPAQPYSLLIPYGRVGIGTDAPAKELDVNGQINGSELCIDGDCLSSWAEAYPTFKMTAKSYVQGDIYYAKSVSYSCAGDPNTASATLKEVTDGTYQTVNSCVFLTNENNVSLTNYIIRRAEGFSTPGNCGGNSTVTYALASSCEPETLWSGYLNSDCTKITCHSSPADGCDVLFLCSVIRTVGQ